MGGSCDQVCHVHLWSHNSCFCLQACVDACVSVAKSSKSEHTAVQAWCVLVTILKDSRALNKDWENLVRTQNNYIHYSIYHWAELVG